MVELASRLLKARLRGLRRARLGLRRSWLLLALSGGLCTAALASCSSDAPQAIGVAVAPPTVTLAPAGTQQFTAAVTGTQRTAVDWSVEPATCGSITSAGVYTAPDAEGPCTVRATAQVDTSKSATAAVTVAKSGPAVPVIASFTASPAVIAGGATSTLAWSVTGADSLSIDQGIGPLAVTATSTSVQPTATTTYTLTATNAAGPVSKTATVTLAGPAPVVSSFTATPASINAGQTSTLAWSVTGATSLSIDQGVGVVTGTTSKTVQPATGTTYTLTATGPTGTATKQVAVAVTGAPLITGFTATPAQLTSGQSTTLSWTLSGGPATLSIDQGVGALGGGATSTSVSPVASTTYLLSATGAGVTAVMPVTVTVNPASPAAVIHEFTADSAGIDASNASAVARTSAVTIKGGGSATLRWSVANASSGQVSIDQGIGTQPAAGSRVVSPAVTTVYTLTASGGGKSSTALVTVGVNTGVFQAPGAPGAADVTVTVDTGLAVRPISPYVYGYNAGKLADAPAGVTWLRQGGNRWTAWNWENNHSNAGNDYGPYHNDDYLSSSTTPGAAIKPTLDETQSASGPGYAALITLPLQGWVSSLFFGNVSITEPQGKYFYPSSPRKGSTLLTSPSTTDGVVYQDELVHWIDSNYPLARTDPKRPIHFSLDNEPDLWSSTHAEIQRGAVTYAGLISKSVNLSAAVKDQLPGALVYGPASYGWQGYLNLQNAPDAANRDFLDTYLAAMKAASEAQGRRLLDVLDLHYYSEVYAGNTRVGAPDNTAPVAAARVQSTRSLWEASYVENSWITCCLGVPAGDGQPGGDPAGVDLVPRMLGKIHARYPGTRLAITEYDFGGADHISGAVAQADALGIFGRSGVYAASQWPEGTANNNQRYVFGAYRLYRNYDGNGGVFGDTSASAMSSDWSKISAHASFNAGHPEKLFVVVINRDTVAHTVALKLNHTQTLTTYAAWQIAEPAQVAGSSVVPKALGSQSLSSTNATSLNLCAGAVTGCGSNNTQVPPLSATLLVLQ